MYRARSLASAITAAVVTAAALATVIWTGAELAARGTSQAILPTMLTTGSFAGLEWPFRTDQPPVSVHVTFYLAVVLVALVAAAATYLATRRASPRNGAAALLGTWFGVVLGSVLAALLVYFIRVDALAASAGTRNELLTSMLSGFAFGGLLLGIVPALLSWAAFKIANRTRAAEYTEAMDLAEGRNVDENPFDLAPGSIGDVRPVEPGFTYPAGDGDHEPSYRDADLPPSARRAGTMTFSDVTDATGEDFADSGRDRGADFTKPDDVDTSVDDTLASGDAAETRVDDVEPTTREDLDTRAADYGLGEKSSYDADAELRKTGS